jgi:hypothetical protein
MAETVLTVRLKGADEATGQLRGVGAQFEQLGATAARANATATAATQRTAASMRDLSGVAARARASFGDFSAAMSGAAAVASIFARGNEDLRRQLEVLSMTLAVAGASTRAFGASLRFVVGVVGWKVTAVAALAGAIIALVRNWDAARSAAVRIWGDIGAWFRRVFGSIGDAARGLGQILLGAVTFDVRRIQAGWATLTEGLRGLGRIAVDTGRGLAGAVGDMWAGVQRLFGGVQEGATGVERGVAGVRRGAAATRRDLSGAADAARQMADEALRAGRVWEGAASEAERAAGMMGRSTAISAAAARAGLAQQLDLARAVLDFEKERLTAGQGNAAAVEAARAALVGVLRNLMAVVSGAERVRVEQELWRLGLPAAADTSAEIAARLREQLDVARAVLDSERERLTAGQSTAEAVDAARGRLVQALRAYAAIAGAAERVRIETEIWRLELTPVVDTHSRIVANLKEQLDVARAVLDFETSRLHAGEGTAQAVADARTALIQALQAYMAVAGAAERVRIQMELWRLQIPPVVDLLRQRFGELSDHITAAFRGVHSAFESLFTDVLSGARSFGESMEQFFSNLANAVIGQLARIAAQWAAMQIWRAIFPGLPIPIPGFQRGGEMVVTRPTLMTVGEAGAERVRVEPLAHPLAPRQREPQPAAPPTVLMPITIHAVDAESFLHLARRSGQGLSEIMLEQMRRNAAIGKLLGGAATP